MNRDAAIQLISQTFDNPFDEKQFGRLTSNILNEVDRSKAFASRHGQYIPEAFKGHIRQYKRPFVYTDPNGERLDVLIVRLHKTSGLERARTMQRNFISWYLKQGHSEAVEAALVAFYHDDAPDWRFSLVRLEYVFGEAGVEEKLTPARRYSYLVGPTEPTHTAEQQLLPFLLNDAVNPTIDDLTGAFQIETVSKQFFEAYKELFLRLTEAIETTLKRDAAVASDFRRAGIHLPSFAKKLLGQIVFLYFIQKKGWLGVEPGKDWGTGPRDFLRQLFQRSQKTPDVDFFNDILEPLFYDALAIQRPDDLFTLKGYTVKIPFLNGGLFEPMGGYDWRHTNLALPNALFSNRKDERDDSATGILDVFDRYNFTVWEEEPLEKEVAVDPEMLGKVFENLLEVQDRKSKGAFYTPREIVHYMCQESLIDYLDTTLNCDRATGEQNEVVPRQAITKLVRLGSLALQQDAAKEAGLKKDDYVLPEAVRTHAAALDEALADIKLCDPAIGSGAFPVGMLHEIVQARQATSIYLDQTPAPYDLKRHAIQESIYGVDIDGGAVEIAKLRLWLSLVVDEDRYDAIQPLPNLDYKIVQGDSLGKVEKNLFNVALFADLDELKRRYFDETHPREKTKLRAQIDQLIGLLTNGKRDFDFEIYFHEVFEDRGGFDVVIGNPPYIDSEGMVNAGLKHLRDFITKNYKFTKGNWDIYIAFFEQGFRILNQSGVLTFITPDKWLAKPFGKELRKNLMMNIRKILITGREVFVSANVDSIVTFISVNETSRLEVLKYDSQNGRVSLINVVDKGIIKPPYMLDFLFSRHLNFLLRIESQPYRLSHLTSCENACATSDAYKLKPFILDIDGEPFLSDTYLKIINTGTIDRFISKWGRRPMVYLGDKYLYPVVIRDVFLHEFANSYSRKAVRPKVIIKGLTLLHSCIDISGVIVPGKSTLVVLSENDDLKALKFAMGLLNSKLPIFFIREKYSASSYNTGINFTKHMINTFPLPKISEKQFNEMVAVVDQILRLKNSNPEANTEVLENTIDNLVYHLYGLTPEEIALIEESVA